MAISSYDCLTHPNSSLKEIMREFNNSYDTFVNAYYTNYIKDLNPGTPLPPKDRIYTDMGKERFNNEVVSKYRKMVSDIFDDAMRDTHKKLTEIPDADVSTMITMLATRNNVSEEEIYQLIDAYGSNHQVYKALQDVAKKNNINVADDDISNRLDELESLKVSIDKAISLNINGQTNGRGYCDFLHEPIDEMFSK